jgi:glycosyltransferase involved in cell wall biosynthesis
MSVFHLLGSSADGGAETYFSDLVIALSQSGLNQTAAIRAHAGRETTLKAASIPTRILGFGGPLDLLTRPRLGTMARNADAKVLVAWMNRAARHTPSGPWARIGRLGGYYDLKNYRGFDVLVGNTPDIARWMVAEGWPSDRAVYIPNFAEAGGDLTVARETLDTPSGVPLLLSMGRLHQVKAHDISLRALQRLAEAYLWIAGTGPLETELKALAVDLGVVDRVRFLGWRDDASALYQTADVCLFTSRYEPLGNVVIQCWAHGLPIVAAASQGPSQLIVPGTDGLLVPIDDADALADGVAQILKDKAFSAQLIANGRAHVQAEFSKASVVARWRNLFAERGEPSCVA